MSRDWIQTASGQKFFPLEPRAADVDIYDIAHALSCLCRYTGHCHSFYSVAQHCVLVSEQAPPGLRLDALLHDAAEAYMGDIATPIKSMITFGAGYTAHEVEHRIDIAIREALRLPRLSKADAARIKVLDTRMMVTEALQLMQPLHADWREWLDGIEPFGIHIQPWKPTTAQYRFLKRYKELRA